MGAEVKRSVSKLMAKIPSPFVRSIRKGPENRPLALPKSFERMLLVPVTDGGGDLTGDHWLWRGAVRGMW